MVTVPCKTRRGEEGREHIQGQRCTEQRFNAFVRKLVHRYSEKQYTEEVLHHTLSGKVNEYRLYSLPPALFLYSSYFS